MPGVDSLADFHGDVRKPALVLYVGGNSYFAVAPFVRAFEEAHPRVNSVPFGWPWTCQPLPLGNYHRPGT